MPTHHQGSPAEVRALDAFIKLTRATDGINARLAHALSDSGLTIGQLGVLEAILHLGPLSQKTLGVKLLRSGANVTTVIDNLEKSGWVRRERSEADRRLTVVSLTREGQRVIERRFPAHARRVVELMAALSPAEQEQLGRLCKKLGRSLPSMTTRRPPADRRPAPPT